MEPEVIAPQNSVSDPLERELSRNRQYAADRRRRHKALGLCAICEAPAVPGQTLCEHHRDRHRATERNRYHRLKHVRARRDSPQARAQNAERRRRLVQRYREQGVCIACGAERAARGVYCEHHREQNRARTARRQAEKRAAERKDAMPARRT